MVLAALSAAPDLETTAGDFGGTCLDVHDYWLSFRLTTLDVFRVNLFDVLH